ncbi:phage tail protein [Pectobacterium brasiliense]|uniref:phage tail protein n=1 Tax=Pectobacterium brasiliense TaxID=180957 RepID=UPI001CE1390D|nr:phage tail protein [Pectobacterium brasiliense]MCA5919226.1 phage tail protein [Pectobacterium brasiliense]MCA5926387.1 phage tail protein [Pectobacterium brasiliense]MCA5935597.1 phage tail protein [Pectobacterium brasiliense]MCA5941528.1 phage tail protein [Pectobacterium brasiliense]MCA5943210.1 phage tail protein [Pectobacterium brasiliense]
MSATYFALLTNIGAAKLANATALGSRLSITRMAVGDGGGVLPTPNPAQTTLIGEKRRAALNTLSVDPKNPSQIIAEQVIPENEGGWWIREIGLFDDDGNLIAIANCPETYKPQLQEGSGRIQTVRMILIVSSTDAVTLKIDPSVVLATRGYVDNAVIEVKAYADNVMRLHLAAADPHPQYAPKASPALTGKPTAPTAAQTSNDTQLATTAFVKTAVAALVNGSPGALDTLKELANALGNDPAFSTTVLNAIAEAKADAANKLNAHASAADPHTQYAPKVSPVLTGTPTAPTAGAAANDTQIATTAFVKAAVAALVNGSPAALDTLQELANALGNDPNFSTTVLNALAGKLAKDQNGADIPDKPSFLSTLLYRGELADGGTFAACNQVGVYRVGINAANTVADAPKNIRGEYLYSYGFLLVEEVNNVINQTYVPHRGPIATRQNWDGAAYSLGWNVMLDGLTNKPTATDIGAFPLNFTGAVNNGDVAWDANSGVYQALFPDASQMIVHFYGGGASCPSLQFLAEYGNSGLSYRTARDGVGFERPWAKFYTTQFKPTAADVGALPITGGALEGGIRIGAGNIDLPATRAVVGVMPDESYRQMLSLSPDNTVVIGSPNSSAVIHTTDRAYIAAAGGAWHSIYHDGNLTTSTIGALPASELAGIPLPFPSAVAPAGWLKCNGQKFDTAQYPVLASRYPSGFLPDLRGEFVRGWDDGRGADVGRGLMSSQADELRSHTHGNVPKYMTGGDSDRGNAGFSWFSVDDIGITAATGGTETRPRNIAFNYIVRAA